MFCTERVRGRQSRTPYPGRRAAKPRLQERNATKPVTVGFGADDCETWDQVTKSGEETIQLAKDNAYGFARKAIFSAQERGDGWVRMYLDGINNSGFSGAPVVYRDLMERDHPLRVAGVVSGYRPEIADTFTVVNIQPHEITEHDRALNRIVTRPDGTIARLVPTGLVVTNNTGIVHAYGIGAAVQLIRKSGAQGASVK